MLFGLGKYLWMNPKKQPDYLKPLASLPDGSYTLVRHDKDRVEIINDTCGSLSVWYIQTEDFFIAASSQRAIILLLQSFDFNPETASWILSAGCLGPQLSWDKRIRLLIPNSRLLFKWQNVAISIKYKAYCL